jgi:hypothetical protein
MLASVLRRALHVSLGKAREKRLRARDLPRLWNATDDEVAARYPCDDLGIVPDDTYFRAIAIAAPPSLAFRWLCQLRVAPYSYDLLDNFARRSPPQLTSGLDDLHAGQRIMHLFRLVSFERDVQMTIVQSPRSPMRSIADFSGTYRVFPDARDPNGCRLVAKILARGPRGRFAAPIREAFAWTDFVMFRKQLLTLKTYCERDAAASDAAANGNEPLPRPR